jgi:O-acetyl-ADP-ribose deacetylase (regulator of RNase III)
MAEIEIIIADITKLEVDAVVNAANSTLLGGGGVDGAIHQAAGPSLLDECMTLGGCPTGEARITGGYDLPARYIIHTVGPVYHDGTEGEHRFLACCYRNCLKLAAAHECSSIAFPAISCGAYRFPIREAALVAIEETSRFLRVNDAPERIVFACASAEVRSALTDAYHLLKQ